LYLHISDKKSIFENKNNNYMKIGDKVLISPDLTKLPNWIIGTVIEVENNPFVGIVISAETEDKNVFFGQEDLFKPQTEEVCLP
jgi:hypothetical protein